MERQELASGKTTYSLEGYSHGQVINSVLKDPFTLALFGLVLSTNLMIILFPLVMHAMEIPIVKKLLLMNVASLVPGYVLLFSMLVSSLRQKMKGTQSTDVAHPSHYRKFFLGVQCVLFASLLCSTFLLREQMQGRDGLTRGGYSEEVFQGTPTPDDRLHAILPLLRECISL